MPRWCCISLILLRVLCESPSQRNTYDIRSHRCHVRSILLLSHPWIVSSPVVSSEYYALPTSVDEFCSRECESPRRGHFSCRYRYRRNCYCFYLFFLSSSEKYTQSHDTYDERDDDPEIYFLHRREAKKIHTRSMDFFLMIAIGIILIRSRTLRISDNGLMFWYHDGFQQILAWSHDRVYGRAWGIVYRFLVWATRVREILRFFRERENVSCSKYWNLMPISSVIDDHGLLHGLIVSAWGMELRN